jgi:formate-dependent nitrite reductase membrane component NrfD
MATFIVTAFGFFLFAILFLVALMKDLNNKVWRSIAYASPIMSAVCFILMLVNLYSIL